MADKPALATMLRHLQQLKKAAARQGMTARVEQLGTTNAMLDIIGVPYGVTCRTNAEDSHHWWYWHNNEPFMPCGDADAAHDAATKLKQTYAAA